MANIRYNVKARRNDKYCSAYEETGITQTAMLELVHELATSSNIHQGSITITVSHIEL